MTISTKLEPASSRCHNIQEPENLLPDPRNIQGLGWAGAPLGQQRYGGAPPPQQRYGSGISPQGHGADGIQVLPHLRPEYICQAEEAYRRQLHANDAVETETHSDGDEETKSYNF